MEQGCYDILVLIKNALASFLEDFFQEKSA